MMNNTNINKETPKSSTNKSNHSIISLTKLKNYMPQNNSGITTRELFLRPNYPTSSRQFIDYRSNLNNNNSNNCMLIQQFSI